MIFSKIKAMLRSIRHMMMKPPDRFLSDVSGVIHVGANYGQERHQYDNLGLRVIWIEPIPDVYTDLIKNIADFPNQHAYQALITNIDGKDYQFYISNNSGESSSILELKEHKDIWPDVNYTNSIPLNSITLASLIKKEFIDLRDYQALVMDTQGSELLVLQGSLPVLKNFKYIKTEVPDFESYKGCCQLDDIEEFMEKHGYVELSRTKFAGRETVGNYFDIVYRRKA